MPARLLDGTAVAHRIREELDLASSGLRRRRDVLPVSGWSSLETIRHPSYT